MKYLEQAHDYFERHPASEECFITSDGRVFHGKGAAEGFAGTLDDTTIEHFKRKTLQEKESKVNTEGSEDAGADAGNIEDADSSTDSSTDENSTEDNEKAEKIEALKNFDISAAKYDEVKNMVKYFELETADQKADTLRAALQNFKNQND